MTEAEAKERWCPYSSVALSEGMAANRTATMGRGGYADITDETRCLGSGCMTWRWEPGGMAEGASGIRHGYCGLAGKP